MQKQILCAQSIKQLNVTGGMVRFYHFPRPRSDSASKSLREKKAVNCISSVMLRLGPQGKKPCWLKSGRNQDDFCLAQRNSTPTTMTSARSICSHIFFYLLLPCDGIYFAVKPHPSESLFNQTQFQSIQNATQMLICNLPFIGYSLPSPLPFSRYIYIYFHCVYMHIYVHIHIFTHTCKYQNRLLVL